ncbi:cation:proton antiporter [Romboutsia sp. 1001713B170207_170306_H8]|uniref:cation:proton antiporter n=1 Tax=Romboutsia sp. 1001713B170207_170306_H8 TaxID=2787112 RepID=UPI0008202AF0|nr:cation:proton antiporter [Romboutsia sp. 1001713B170207_170306_H8]SCH66087.1 Inner membrane protein ybaL [uncultured Clostridium sp.]
MLSYNFLLDLALILLSTKVLGIITKKFQMPQVVGALLAGLILGPAMFNVLSETDFIIQLSELGVIVLMFCAGLESDLQELKSTGKASFIIASLGVVIPLLGGFLFAHFFRIPELYNETSGSIILQNIFIGIILTATSVSITVETLKEMGKLNTQAGTAILGAAIIDDILGIIALTIVTSLKDTSISIGLVLFKIIVFFIFVGVVGFIAYKVFKAWSRYENRDRRRFIIASFVFCLLLSYISEEVFGVADITGAFIAGLVLSNIDRKEFISNRLNIVSYALLSPVFFASIGLKVVLPKMDLNVILFAVILTIIAIITKIIGAGIGAKLCKFSNKESIQIGIGMVSRGEVALIVASKGAAIGLISTSMLGPVIIVVVATTIISPILLKFAFKENNIKHKEKSVTTIRAGR